MASCSCSGSRNVHFAILRDSVAVLLTTIVIRRIRSILNKISIVRSRIMSGTKLIVETALRSAVNLRSSKLPSEIVKSSQALFSAYGGTKHTLPSLSYDYGALARKYRLLQSLNIKCDAFRGSRLRTHCDSLYSLFLFFFRWIHVVRPLFVLTTENIISRNIRGNDDDTSYQAP